MKYICFTYDGYALPIAYKLMKEGKEVIVGMVHEKSDIVADDEMHTAHEDEGEKRRRLNLYKNILDVRNAWDVIEDMKKIVDRQNYFVLFDFNHLFKFADIVKDMGFHGNFPTKEDYLFEADRDGAKEFVNKNYSNLLVAEKKELKTRKQAEEFLQTNDDIWVLKGYDKSARTIVPDVDDPDLARSQIFEALESFQATYESKGFLLELKIPSVIEITPEKIYYDGVPLAVTLNFENKEIGAGNVGIQTGCAMDLVFPIDMNSRICKIAFPPIVDELAKQHKGLFFWDASVLINKRTGKIYFGEFCSNRPGYHSFFTELAQCSSLDSFFTDVVNKRNPFTLGTVGTSVRLFNFHKEPESCLSMSDLTIDYKPKIEKDLWLWDAYKNLETGKLETTGVDWVLATMTRSDKNIEDAVYQMYKNIDMFSFEGAYYRPKFDYLSLDYPTSILNRINYGLERHLYQLPFDVKIGEIEVS